MNLSFSKASFPYVKDKQELKTIARELMKDSGAVCVCAHLMVALCQIVCALDEQMGVDELREAWREGMADVWISLM